MGMLDQSGKKVITQDNTLIEACYGLTLNEKRLLLIGISKINSQQMLNRNEPLSFEVTAQDWLDAYPDSTNPARDMELGFKDLRNRGVTFKTRGRDKYILWLDSTDHYYNEGRVRLNFGWTMSEYLQGMLDCFTTYDLLSIQKLTSIHSIRLYELLSQYKTHGFRVSTLDDIKFSLNLAGCYPLWNDFNNKVLKKAVKELNDKSNYKVSYEPIKKGKKVHAVKFYFTEEQQTDLFKTTEQST